MFDHADFTAPVSTETDAQRFPASGVWSAAPPEASMGPDTWSIRWTGQVMPAYSQDYTFYVETAPGDTAKLWINGQLAVDTAAGLTNAIPLTAKELYGLKLDYVHQSGPASVMLKWSSSSQGKGQISTPNLYRELDQQPVVYPVKAGPGDEHHIVATAAMSVTAATYGALVNGSEYVFQSDTEQVVQGENTVRFQGKTGYAKSGELYLFEGTEIGYGGFILGRTGGDFGVSAALVNGMTISGRLVGRAGGTVNITPPSGFALGRAEVKVNGAVVPSTFSEGVITFQADVAQSEGYKTYTVTVTAAPPLFADDFEDGNADGWSVTGGEWAVADEGAGRVYRQSHASGGSVTAGDAAWSDYSVQAKVTFTGPAAGTADLLGRYSDGNNFYFLQANGVENKLKLYKKTSGAVSLLRSVPFEVKPGRTYSLKLAFAGSSIQGFVDGIALLGAADGDLPAGRIGVRASSAIDVDDVLVH